MAANLFVLTQSRLRTGGDITSLRFRSRRRLILLSILLSIFTEHLY